MPPRLRGELARRRLAPREMEALRTYARLGSQKLVAHEMGISLQTVKNLTHLAYRKLEVSTAIEAFFVLGWVRPPDLPTAAIREDIALAGELRDVLVDMANEAGAMAARLTDLLEGPP